VVQHGLASLTKGQSGEQAQSLDGFGSGQQKKDIDDSVGMRQAQGPTPLALASTHLDRAHPVRRLTAFGMAYRNYSYASFCQVKSTFTFLIIIPE
jgi:hypothetical protein